MLAITPPSSAAAQIDPGIVDAWARGAASDALASELAVLLRDPGAGPRALLDPRGRLAPLRHALAAHGVPALLSVDALALRREQERERILAADPPLAGVQLRGDPDLRRIEDARVLVDPRWFVGRSCHGLPAADEDARTRASDYACVAPIFPPNTAQPGVDKHALGLAQLRRWTRSGARVFALGGVDTQNASACLDAGAFGVAGISLFFGSIANAEDNVAALRPLLLQAPAGPGQDHVRPPRR
nr:thiamine phosphate synthase [Pseudenhygromyxa sp. WMMC2535]